MSSTGKKFALVIGIGGYEERTRGLPAPKNDAEDMTSQLKAAGFAVQPHKDLTRYHKLVTNTRKQAETLLRRATDCSCCRAIACLRSCGQTLLNA
jgi:uncharacterized caspase-like protein